MSRWWVSFLGWQLLIVGLSSIYTAGYCLLLYSVLYFEGSRCQPHRSRLLLLLQENQNLGPLLLRHQIAPHTPEPPHWHNFCVCFFSSFAWSAGFQFPRSCPLFYQFPLPLKKYLLYFIYYFCVFAAGGFQVLLSAKLLVPEVSKPPLKWEVLSFIFFFFCSKTFINCVLQRAQAGSPEQDLAVSCVFVQNEMENGLLKSWCKRFIESMSLMFTKYLEFVVDCLQKYPQLFPSLDPCTFVMWCR